VSAPGGTIRAEEPADHAAVGDVVADAFGRAEEAILVERLRSEHPAAFGPALVAEVEGRLVGYLCCSRMSIDERPEAPILGLGPVAVLPTRQMMGIGSALVHRLQELVTDPIALLGDPAWYARFGFVPAEPLGLRSQWDDVGDAWQVWFPPGASPEGYRGTVRYLPPFDEV
jgi:putative acetyltransferase